MSVGTRIRNAREKLGLSQAELGARVGVSRTAIGQWEGDETLPRPKHVPRLSNTLNMPPSAFTPFGGGTLGPVAQGREAVAVILLQWADLRHIAKGKVMISALKKPAYLAATADVAKDAFALAVVDGSMEPTFHKDDEVILEPRVVPVDHDAVLVRLKSGEHLFRTYVMRRNGAYDLVAENPDWPTVTVNAGAPAEILGVMVEHRRKRQQP